MFTCNQFAVSDKQNEFLEKETFLGVKKILELAEQTGVVVIVIKNVKNFNHIALNDLIHFLKKHRNPNSNENMCFHFCLVLGV